MTPEEQEALIERLTNDPKWIAQIEKSMREFNRQHREVAEGDEYAAAEMRTNTWDPASGISLVDDLMSGKRSWRRD